MANHPSPLRYPGGKASISPFLEQLIVLNDLHDGRIVEPFAGGAGASLQLMFNEIVSDIAINDIDPRIYAFWRAVVNQTEKLVSLIMDTDITMDVWNNCQRIYRSGLSRYSQVQIAFAVFFLNRCNRSGILMGGGPIGGYEQSGKWKLDARFNRLVLVERIRRIASYGNRVSVTRLSANELLLNMPNDNKRTLVFLDPPYYEKGQRLYLNALEEDDHKQLADILRGSPKFNWVLTYDNVEPIRRLYGDFEMRPFELNYSASARRMGREIMIFDPRIRIPNTDVWASQSTQGRL
jgi:DNA adenine methylase